MATQKIFTLLDARDERIQQALRAEARANSRRKTYRIFRVQDSKGRDVGICQTRAKAERYILDMAGMGASEPLTIKETHAS